MAYATYITDAIVCGTTASNTSDKSYLLFTREAGMVWAVARSVREEKSKQRYALQEFSAIRISLIKGKSGWRIGSVEAKENYYHDAVDKAARGSVVKLIRLLRRFIQGEEAAAQLFDFVRESMEVVIRSTDERAFLDTAIELRILHLLGYVRQKDMPESIKDVAVVDIEKGAKETVLSHMQRSIESATKASHL